MENNIRVSVVMATYNGEKYIKEQIDSILMNLEDNDEIIISDDGSIDNTCSIIKEYKDSRIKLIEGPRKGVKKNFENAIINSSGEYIFLCDQDDIWDVNKVSVILKKFKDDINTTLIVHDAIVFDTETNKNIYNSFFEFRNSGNGILKNIYKNTYIGCCMSFRAILKKYIIPIPENIEMHDQWIGILNEISCGKTVFLKEKLIKYRRHSNNVSQLSHHSLKKMIVNRIKLIVNIILMKVKKK